MNEAGEMPQVPRKLHEVVAGSLTAAIEDGRLRPGTLLRAAAVAEAFEVSRVSSTRALDDLVAAQRVTRHPEGGFLVGPVPQDAKPVQVGSLEDLVSDAERQAIRFRSWRDRLYPQVEREVAGCLLFGRFQIRSQALAQNYGVSRTVANELITRLERVGIVQREANGRWYAGPLTRERIADLFEMRALLEPAALLQAAPLVASADIKAMLKRVQSGVAQGRSVDPGLLHRLEVDLHHDIVLRCANREMRDALYRYQLPLIASHLAFESSQTRPEIPPMLDAHLSVLTHLAERRWLEASQALAAHLRQSASAAPERLDRLSDSSVSIPTYLSRL